MTTQQNKTPEELAKELELRTKEIVIEAKNLAEHSGRRTILRRDVKMARRIRGK